MRDWRCLQRFSGMSRAVPPSSARYLSKISRRRLLSLATSAFVGVAMLGAQPRQALPDPLDLETAISIALENNLAIRQARERVRTQHGVVTTVSAAGLPTFSAAGTLLRSDTPTILSVNSALLGTGANLNPNSIIFAPAGRFWRLTFTGTQTLYAGGGIRGAVRSAGLARDAATLDLQATINEALLDARVRFYDVLHTREQIRVQERNLEVLQTQLRYAQARVEAGTAPEFERLRAEVAVANARAPLIRARNDFRLAFEELRRVLGVTTNEPEAQRKIPEFTGTLEFKPEKLDLEAAFAAAQANRPDLRRLAKLVAARGEDVDVARARYFPSVSIYGAGELRKGATDRLNDSIDGARGGVQSRWEIGSRATAGAVVQGGSLLEQARLTEAEARLAAEIEVRRAFSAIEQASELAAATQQGVAQAEEAVRLAQARFEAGTATQLDLLQAQAELTSARTSLLRANHGYNVAVAQLRKAVGAADVEYHDTALGENSPP